MTPSQLTWPPTRDSDLRIELAIETGRWLALAYLPTALRVTWQTH